LKLSSGISISFGKDYLGHAIIVDSETKSSTLSNSPEWRLVEGSINQTDIRRFWRIHQEKTLERTIGQCPIDFFIFLQQELGKLPVTELHPALVNGFEMEAERLLPNISEKSNTEFKSFIALLKSSYTINELEEQSKVMSNFVDDIGPNLLVIIDNQPSLIPEIPPIYLAPNDWPLAMWQINNHMIGPLLGEDLEDQDKIQFLGLTASLSELSERQKGLYYFHMARFILFFEAWVEDPKTPYLLEFIRLFRGGFRYFG
jgi:hypothetical protein